MSHVTILRARQGGGGEREEEHGPYGLCMREGGSLKGKHSDAGRGEAKTTDLQTLTVRA